MVTVGTTSRAATGSAPAGVAAIWYKLLPSREGCFLGTRGGLLRLVPHGSSRISRCPRLQPVLIPTGNMAGRTPSSVRATLLPANTNCVRTCMPRARRRGRVLVPVGHRHHGRVFSGGVHGQRAATSRSRLNFAISGCIMGFHALSYYLAKVRRFAMRPKKKFSAEVRAAVVLEYLGH